MKDLLRSSFPQMSLLQSLPALELHAPVNQIDLQPFSPEHINYTNKVRAIALAFFIIGLLAIGGTLCFEVWQRVKSSETGLTHRLHLSAADYLRWDVIISKPTR